MRPAYDRLATLDEVLRRAGELSPKTLVFDVEPMVAYWDGGQEALDRGLRSVLALPEPRILLVWHALAIRYVLDAAEGLVPAPLITPVDHAFPHHLRRSDVERATDLLEAWSREPRFRALPGTMDA